MEWGPLLAAGIQAGGSLLGGMIGSSGQQATNAQSLQFAAQQAQMNRDWQERMSDTAYQRGMADMKAAGLNPILAANLGGASTPGGATAAMPSLGNPSTLMAEGVSSAAGAAGTYNATKLAAAQSEKDSSQVDLNKASTTNTQAATGLTTAATEKAKAETATSAGQLEVQKSQIRNNDAQAGAAGASAALDASRKAIADYDAVSAKHKATIAGADAHDRTTAGAGHGAQVISDATRMAGTAANSAWGSYSQYVGQPFSKFVGGLVDRFRSGQGPEIPHSARQQLPSENPGLSGAR